MKVKKPFVLNKMTESQAVKYQYRTFLLRVKNLDILLINRLVSALALACVILFSVLFDREMNNVAVYNIRTFLCIVAVVPVAFWLVNERYCTKVDQEMVALWRRIKDIEGYALLQKLSLLGDIPEDYFTKKWLAVLVEAKLVITQDELERAEDMFWKR